VTISACVQTFNGIALLAISQHKRFSTHKFAGPAIFGGTILFSGSILALAALKEKCVSLLASLSMVAETRCDPEPAPSDRLPRWAGSSWLQGKP